MISRRVVIVGAGDHGRVMLELLRASGTEPVGFVEVHPSPDDAARRVDGLNVIGNLDAPAGWAVATSAFVVALGDNRARREAYERCLELGLEPEAAIHPRAILLGGARVTPGAMVCAGAIVGVAATVGPNAIVNTGATVDHDNVIEAHAHVGPGAHLAGHVTVEEGAFVGIGSAVREGCRIGAWALVGGGAMVIGDVEDGGHVIGVPARPAVERGG
jgi:sugar O-acyltransferase (sialic acid O-acetyltransferase NeuD family)